MIEYPDFSNLDPVFLKKQIMDGIEQLRKEISDIKQIEIDKSTFVNVILKLEKSGIELSKWTSIFFNLLHTDSSEERQLVAQEIIPELTRVSNEINYDVILSEQIKVVYETSNKEQLSVEDNRLLQRTYQGYKDRGAYLSQEKKKRLKEINQKLGELELKFSHNVISEQDAFSYLTDDLEEIKGLPANDLLIAREKAESQGKKGYLFDLSYPSYLAILKYADSRELRRFFYLARHTLCNKDNKSTYNGDIIRQIVELRLQKAQILGCSSYAEFSLKRKMAKTPNSVYKMLDSLRDSYMSKAQEEVALVKKHFIKHSLKDCSSDFMPWDWIYATEHYRKTIFDLDQNEIRPYFPLSKVLKHTFRLATKLYGIKFEEIKNAPKYRDDVKVFIVRDANGHEIGVLYTDFFAREGKQSGAWMTSFSDRFEDLEGNLHLPIVSIVMNFSPATKEMPSLLSIDEITTLLHEFGHALHGLLTKVNHVSIGGTNVVRDFVELPSQIMENFFRQEFYIKEFSSHYKTGEKISQELVDKILFAQNFLVAYSCIRQLTFGYLDMRWHSSTKKADIKMPEKLEVEVLESIGTLLPQIDGTSISTSFNHIFSGGYAAGYYGYKWAEILDADAFEMFILDNNLTHASEKFLHEILEKGDIAEPEILYQNFKGSSADLKPLLRRDGII